MALAISVAGEDPGSPVNPFHGFLCFSCLPEAWLSLGECVSAVSWPHGGRPTFFKGVSPSQLASRAKAGTMAMASLAPRPLFLNHRVADFPLCPGVRIHKKINGPCE